MEDISPDASSVAIVKREVRRDKLLGYIFAFSFLLLFLNTITTIWPANTNHAAINFIASILPSLFFIISNKTLKAQKKTTLLVVLLCLLQIVTLALNVNFDSQYDNYADVINTISYIVNIIGLLLILRGKNHDSVIMRKCIIIIISCTILFCLYNILVNINQIDELFNPKLASTVSFASFCSNRNNFAKILYLSIIILYYAKNKKIIGKKMFFLILFVFVANLIATLSRTGIISTLLFMIMTPLVGRKKHIIKVVSIVVLAAIIISLSNATEFVNSSIIRANAGDSGRTEIWQSALPMVKEKPIFGYGEHNAAKTLNQEVGNSYFHNKILKDLVVQGILYTIVYMIFVVSVGRKPLHNKLGRYRNIIIATYISTAFYCMFEGFDFFNFGLVNSLATMVVFILPNIYNIDNDASLVTIRKDENNEG